MGWDADDPCGYEIKLRVGRMTSAVVYHDAVRCDGKWQLRFLPPARLSGMIEFPGLCAVRGGLEMPRTADVGL